MPFLFAFQFIIVFAYDTFANHHLATTEDLIEYFSQFGQVANVNIKYNSSTGHPRGFGFITFASEDTVRSQF